VRKTMNRLAIMSLIILPVVGLAVPAGASTSTPTVRVIAVTPMAHPLQQNVNIVGNGAQAIYSPHRLTAPEDTTNGCKTGFISFTVTNTGTKTEYITINGAGSTSAPPGFVVDYCETGAFPGYKLRYGLSNKNNTVSFKAKLKVIFSN
jgi:hypothetical protein